MSEKPTVYLETTIPSYLTSRPSNDVLIAGKQEATRQWWEQRKGLYQLYISELVMEEMNRGDREAAQRRLDAVSGIDIIEIDDKIIYLTGIILNSGIIPEKAAGDAGHIAVASIHNMDYLLTWNCTHIANAEIIRRISFIVSEAGYSLPFICTPLELFGVETHDE